MHRLLAVNALDLCYAIANANNASSFLQLEHDIGYFNVFLVLILHRHLEDDVLLVIRDGLLANRFYQLAQSAGFV